MPKTISQPCPQPKNKSDQRPRRMGARHATFIHVPAVTLTLQVMKITQLFYLCPPVGLFAPVSADGLQMFKTEAVLPARSGNCVRPERPGESLAKIPYGA